MVARQARDRPPDVERKCAMSSNLWRLLTLPAILLALALVGAP
jgi:hypothetical protein